MPLDHVDPNDTHMMSQALKALRDAEGLLPALIENLPGGAVFVVDRDLRYLLAEGEALATAGFQPEDFVGQTIFEVLPPELGAQCELSYRQALAGEPFETEHNSHNHWYITRGTPLRSPNGDIYAVLAVSFDITDRKRVEEKRKQAEADAAADLEDMQRLHELSARLVTEDDIQTLYQEIVATAIALTHADAGTVQILDETTQELLLLATQGFEQRTIDHFYRVNASSNTPCSMALTAGERTFVNFDVPQSEDPHGSMRIHLEVGLLSAQSTPLITRSGKPIGMFSTHWRKHHRPTDRELRSLDLLARQAADLIEQRQVEANLRASETRYRTLFETMGQGYSLGEVIRDEADRVIDVRFVELNPAFGRLSGISLAEAQGRTALEVFGTVEENWFETIDRVIQTGRPERVEYELAAINRWYEVYFYPADGDRHLGLYEDITERKRNEQRQAYLLQLSDALRSLSDAVEIHEAVTRIAMNFFGADRCYYCEIIDGSAIIRRDASREGLPSVVGEYPLSSFPILKTVIDAGQPFVVEDAHTTDVLDEALRQLCCELQVISFIDVPVIKEGKPAGVLCVTQSTPRNWTALETELAQETAERIWAAVERARAEASLREAELQRVREQSAREQERQRAEALAELDRAKTLFFSNISHEFRTPLTLSLAPLQDALSDRTLSDIQRERLELVHRNNLRLLKLVNTLLDFSRIEAGRVEALYEPTDLATFTTELASVFRSAIERAGLQLMVDCPPLPEPVYVDREMWEKIVLNLLSNAFKFTFEGEISVSLRAESRAELHASPSNRHHSTSAPHSPTSELVTPTSELQISSSELETSTLELETFGSELEALTSEPGALTSEPETLTSEPGALTSELETLPSKLKTSSSELHTSPAPTHVILKIRDTGTGIAPEHLPHLFERFYQVRGTQARTHKGSGIGLALVHELVRLHGGTIEVSSTMGQGTCFTITLPFGTDHLPSEQIQATRSLTSTGLGADPYIKEAEQWLPQESAAFPPPTCPALRSIGGQNFPELGDLGDENMPRSDAPSSPPRVLIVDDNADMRQYLTRILSDHVQVAAVADGAAALAAIQAQPPDLVLSDVMMPRLDGFGLLQTLRTNPQTRNIPVILLSARAGEEAIAEGLDRSADDYLIKPFSAQELISRVNAHLQISHLRGEALHAARTAIRIRDELLSVVSHELNTPLVSILGWTRLLRANPTNPAMLSTALETIEHSATMQAKLVQDLLDVSRIAAGKLRLHLQPTDLDSVIKGAIATVTQIAAEAGIDLLWSETAAAVVMGDRERLQQAVCNLLTNAIKFTPQGGRVEVSLSVITSDRSAAADAAQTAPDQQPPDQQPPDQQPVNRANYAEIGVTDTGSGITPDFLPHLFEQFQQAERATSAKGLGLGLAIARHIVELHNGTIQAQSAGAGQGATFMIRIPLLKPNH